MFKRMVKEAAAATGTRNPKKATSRNRNRSVSTDSSADFAREVRNKRGELKVKTRRGKREGNNSSDDEDVSQSSSTTDAPRKTKMSNTKQRKSDAMKRAANAGKMKRAANAGKMKRAPLLEYDVIEAVYSAVTEDVRKQARRQLLEIFASYDPDDTGAVDVERFKKCLIKSGVKLKSSEEYHSLAQCFEKNAFVSVASSDTEQDTNRKNSNKKMRVDYLSFIDFACNVRDSEKLNKIAEKLRSTIEEYDDKHNRTTSAPYNIYNDLQKLDKQKRKWIGSEQFVAFMEEHVRPTFRLTSKELSIVVERFEYEYGNDELGFDYEQFGQWLQPLLHLNIKQLHERVKQLVKKAHDHSGWKLEEIFEAMDEDGNCEISGMELKEALIEMGLPLTDVQIRCLVDEYDVNGDGRIQYEEFLSLFAPESNKRKKKNWKSKRNQRSTSEEESDGTDVKQAKKLQTKRTVRNSFSWGIGKAFARKRLSKNNIKHNSKTHKPAASSSPSSSSSVQDQNKREIIKNKKKATGRAHRMEDDSTSNNDTDKRIDRKTKSRMKRSAPRAQTLSSSSSDSEQENTDATRNEGKRTRVSQKRQDRELTQTSTESEVDTRSRKARKARAHNSLEVFDDNKSTTDGATKSKRLHPKTRRRERMMSPASNRSRRSKRGNRSPSQQRRRPTASMHRSGSRQSIGKRQKRRLSSQYHRVSRSRRDMIDNESFDDTNHQEDDYRSHSSSSGLDANQLRQLKKTGNKYYTHGASEDLVDMNSDLEHEYDIQSRSDVEYDKHLKKSLRRAFDFFDLDQNETIEKRELSHVLRALGHEFTSDELDAEMEQADLDRNGELDFHEFVAFVRKQLAEKAFLLTKQREMEIRHAFQSLDTDKNGILDEKEFEYMVYKVLQVELSVEEQDALMDFIDTNKDGTVSEEEFISFMKIMDEFHNKKGRGLMKQKKFMTTLDGTSKLACSAMKKLVRGAPIDLERNLLMFFGIPTNFRPAISAASTCRVLESNTMEHSLSWPSPQTILGLAQDPPILAVSNAKRDEQSEEYMILRQVESFVAQAVVSLKRATGVPKPFDTREEDVVKRCVHVCLFQEQEQEVFKKTQKKNRKSQRLPTHGNENGSGGVVVGNVHEIPIYWQSSQEDVWEFSKRATKEDKYKFLVRTNAVNDHLFLLVEFIVHLKMENIVKEKKDRRRKQRTYNETTGDSQPLPATREMVCCWCKIPIRTLLAKRADVFRLHEKLWGGTAHAPIDIEQDEILRRRTGWRAVTNMFKKPTPSVVGIKCVPVDAIPQELQKCVQKMPPIIIAPFVALPILAEYMTMMGTRLSSHENSMSVASCDPVLKLLPKIVDDHKALSIFRRVFDTEVAPLKTAEDRHKKFQELVLRMWPCFIKWHEPVPPTLLRQVSSSNASTKALSLLSPKAPTSATSQPNDRSESESRAHLIQNAASGMVRLLDLPIATTPFHIREVAFKHVL